MASVDPYSPCPCGSGQKFKWCCHKVEAYADRAQRLVESGQFEAALDALDEGLRKEPGNAWLLTRKALIQVRNREPGAAKETIRKVLQKAPKHAGALTLMTRLALETEGPAAGAAQLQQALTAFPAENRRTLAPLVKVVAAFLSEAGEYPAALRHLRLAEALGGPEPDPTLASTARMIEASPSIDPWQKNPDELAPPPDRLAGDARARFAEALGWAGEGLWSSAASAFETLSSDPNAGPAADRNLGLCRLWLADGPGAVPALRRYAAALGNTPEAVDAEALAQQFAEPGPDDLAEQVQLIWPLRNRQALVDALGADPAAHPEESGPIDPDDPDSPEVDHFALLDRPRLASATPDLRFDAVPRVVGRVLVGDEIVALETYDDGRLDRLAERFTALAGASIPPAHPKTKVMGKVPRLQLAMMWEWLLPEGTDPEQARRLTREQSGHVIREVWVRTPHPALRGRTPLQAAQAGNAEVPLRAAVLQLEQARQSATAGVDFAALREALRIPPEPPVDPSTVDIDALHLSRLALVPADRLDDARLAALYRRARRFMIEEAIDRAARAFVARPEAMGPAGVDSRSVYSDIASLAATRGRTEEAFDWVRRGRQADAPAARLRNAPAWDMLEVQIRTRTEPPESWVPEIAAILDRYSADPKASQVVMMSLLDMGLLEMVSSPDRPGEVSLDSRPLQALLAEYGPRVTTASGRLGVSATKPEIWTPGSEAAAGGGLWTPGAGAPAAPGGEKKLIIPGR